MMDANEPPPRPAQPGAKAHHFVQSDSGLGLEGVLEAREAARQLQCLLLGRVFAGEDAAVLRALFTENASEAPGVDAGETDKRVAFQPVVKVSGGPPVRRPGTR